VTVGPLVFIFEDRMSVR